MHAQIFRSLDEEKTEANIDVAKAGIWRAEGRRPTASGSVQEKHRHGCGSEWCLLLIVEKRRCYLKQIDLVGECIFEK